MEVMFTLSLAPSYREKGGLSNGMCAFIKRQKTRKTKQYYKISFKESCIEKDSFA